MSPTTGEPGPDGAAAGTESGLRQVTDARTMRALAHPVRIALIEALSLSGPMTATEVGEMIGESPTTCSFHLRQLAKYGFVEDAETRPGRSRPWRMTSIGREFTPADDDPEAVIALLALVRMARERQFARYRTWLDTRANYPKAWRDAAGDSEYTFFVTAEELDQLNSELYALLIHRFEERRADRSRRPPGSVPVEMLVLSYPRRLPETE
jgi:DNA-binding transcriptional ArsR family regulator